MITQFFFFIHIHVYFFMKLSALFVFSQCWKCIIIK